MSGRVVADNVDHPGTGFLCVVYVRKTVGQTGAQVEQRGCRVIPHPVPAVGRTGCDTFKKAQDATETRILERGEEVHLGRSRIGETDEDSCIGQGGDQTFSSVQVAPSFQSPKYGAVPIG